MGLIRKRPDRAKSGKWDLPKQLAILLGSTALIGYLTVRVDVPLVELRPAYGWYWPLMVAAGCAVAVGIPVLVWRASRSPSWRRWPTWLLVGYCAAIVAGMDYFFHISVNTAAASASSIGTPPLRYLLELAALAFTAACLTGLTVLLVGTLPARRCVCGRDLAAVPRPTRDRRSRSRSVSGSSSGRRFSA